MKKPKAVMVPFGYPGYPVELMRRFTNASSRYLKKLGIDLATTSIVIDFDDTKKVMAQVRKQDFDFMVVLVLSWLEAPNVVEVTREFAHKPMLLWSHTMFKEKGNLRTLGPFPSVGVLRQTFEEMGWNFRFVFGMPGEKKMDQQIPPFARAASAMHKLQHSRIGLVGYLSMGMYTAAFDHLGLRRDFGPEVDQLDQYVLIKRLESLKASEVRPLIAKAKKQWNLGKAVREKDLRISLRMYLALKQLAKEHRWDAVNVKCQYELSKDYGYTPCVPLSLLGNDLPCSCEGDIPLITTQLLIYYLTGKITSYCDIHTVDENELLMGACGFAPFGLGTGRPKVDRTVTLYQGLANCTQYKEGRITIARLSYTRERKMQLHVATGQAQAPRDFREVGCLPYPGMDMVLDGDTEDFAQHIMSQHYAVVYGDITQDLEEFCNLVPVEIIRVKS